VRRPARAGKKGINKYVHHHPEKKKKKAKKKISRQIHSVRCEGSSSLRQVSLVQLGAQDDNHDNNHIMIVYNIQAAKRESHTSIVWRLGRCGRPIQVHSQTPSEKKKKNFYNHQRLPIVWMDQTTVSCVFFSKYLTLTGANNKRNISK
jgi:hypothetical protein